MYWNKISVLIFVLILSACAQKSEDPYANHSVLIETKAWVDGHRDLEPYVYVDLRSPELFEQGHLPGAINLTRGDVRKSDSEIGGMAMEADSLAIVLGSKGISSDAWLILYDEKGGVEAARLWWMLKVYGHNRVKILNGDLHLFDKELEDETAPRSETVFNFEEKPVTDWSVDYTEFERLRAIPSTVVLDCRSTAEFNGEYIKPGAFLAGHIDGAINFCYSNTIESASEGNLKMKSPEALRVLYQDLAQADDTILVYCQSGVRSAHTLMVLREILDYKHVYNYDGSWIEWSHKNQPVQKDSLVSI